MKKTHNFYYQQQGIERITEYLSAKKLLQEKVRINLYVPKVIVQLMDLIAKNVSRGELVTSLIIKEFKKRQKLPYGMFSPLEISEKQIKEITSSWEKAVNELT